MSSRRLIEALVFICIAAGTTACGGGESDSSSSPQADSLTGNSQPPSLIELKPLTLTRINTPLVVDAYLDFLQIAKDTAADIVNGEHYTGLPDGTYTDSCEGGGGSFEIEVSNNGSDAVYKYTNCSVSATQAGVTVELLVSGEQSISRRKGLSSSSSITIGWNDYSASLDGATMIFDGSLKYTGPLQHDFTFSYSGITSTLEVDLVLSDGTNRLSANDVTLTVDFPAIFNRYKASGFGTVTKPDLPHIFSRAIHSIEGELGINDTAVEMSWDANGERLVFSGASPAASYLDATRNGFFILWDEEADGLVEANVFLTENEYPFIYARLGEESTDIYFTRYTTPVSSLPPAHPFAGSYAPVSLSRSASVEIDVQELFTNKAGSLLTYEINNQRESSDWKQTEAGRFKLLFPNSTGHEIYELEVTAVDANGNRSPAITVTVYMNDDLADTDGDGVLDIDDPDRDNDGVVNGHDRFPKNPEEWADLDDDRIGDNSDTDLDNDGVVNDDDAFPRSVTCSSPDAGDEYGCYLDASYAFDDGESIIYFVKGLRLLQFDTNTNSFLVPSHALDMDGYVSTGVYDPVYNKVLMHDYQNKKLILVDLDNFSVFPVRDAAENSMTVRFSEHGYFVVSVTEPFSSSWIEVYDHNGTMVDSNKEEALANPTSYFSANLQRQESIPFCSYSVSVTVSGELVVNGEVSFGYDDVCQGTNSTSESQLYTFPAGSDSVYNIDMELVAEVDGNQKQWMNDTLIYTGSDGYSLVADDLFNGYVQDFKSENYLGLIRVVGDKIISFSPGGYNKAARLMIFNSELDLKFDSTSQ